MSVSQFDGRANDAVRCWITVKGGLIILRIYLVFTHKKSKHFKMATRLALKVKQDNNNLSGDTWSAKKKKLMP